MNYFLLLLIYLHYWNFKEVKCHKEEECVEVGFARSSYLTVDQGYQAAKEELLTVWKNEDDKGFPAYKNLSPQAKNITRAASLLEKTSQNILGLIRKTRVGKRCPEEWLLKGLEKHVTPLIQLEKEFAEVLGLVMSYRCLVGSPYPNVDGTCINEEGPDMGSISSKFLRLIPPITGRGGFSIRSSVNKDKTLPSARQVAQVIRRHIVKPDVTALFTEFSHFIAMDTFSIPESPVTEDVDCCKNPEYPDCAPIFLDESDPLYSKIKCFNFKRSTPAQAILGHRESLSMISTYLDATPVYGPTNEEAFKIKEGYFGYLKYPNSLDDGGNEKARKKNCQFPESFKGCFGLPPKEKGYLENLRLLLTLEHNLIADSLAEINPHFDDSLLYNEARRILIAEYDAIIYGEFIPLLVGKELAEKHSLLPGSEGPGARYIPEVNPGILTSYALGSHRNPSMIDEWKEELGQTDILNPLHYESVRFDPYQDLLAMDIQRGRDHGLPQYGTWRSFCDSGKDFHSWDAIATVFSEEVVSDIKSVYQEEIEDFDLLLALLEKPENESVVGKTFSCILVDQFARLKTGNRLFWEHETSMFTMEQRDAIRSHSSAAGLICRHFGVEKVAKNPFKSVSESNPEVDCSSIPNLNLTAWIDTSLIEVMKKKKEEEELKKKEEELASKKEQVREEIKEDGTGGKEEKLVSADSKEDETGGKETVEDPEKLKQEERKKQEEKIKQEIIEREIKLEEQRQKEEERMAKEEEMFRIQGEEQRMEDRNKEMREAEERIKEEMKLKEEKRKLKESSRGKKVEL